MQEAMELSGEEYFLGEVGEQYYVKSVKYINEDKPEEAIDALEKALEHGLSEVLTIEVLYLLGYVRSLMGAKAKDVTRILQAIEPMEQAVTLDRQGKIGYFAKPKTRKDLQRLDILYNLKAQKIEEKEGVQAAIAFRKQKVSLFDYLSSPPLLATLYALGVAYYQGGEDDLAQTCWEGVVDADPVDSDSEKEMQWKQQARDALQKLEEVRSSSNYSTSKRYAKIIQEEEAKKKSGGCYIATACYGSYNAPEVIILRQYRDETLSQSSLGRILIRVYYTYSPYLADRLKSVPTLNSCVKKYILDTIVTFLNERR